MKIHHAIVNVGTTITMFTFLTKTKRFIPPPFFTLQRQATCTSTYTRYTEEIKTKKDEAGKVLVLKILNVTVAAFYLIYN
jgi:hypothetical protein